MAKGTLQVEFRRSDVDNMKERITHTIFGSPKTSFVECMKLADRIVEDMEKILNKVTITFGKVDDE